MLAHWEIHNITFVDQTKNNIYTYVILNVSAFVLKFSNNQFFLCVKVTKFSSETFVRHKKNWIGFNFLRFSRP